MQLGPFWDYIRDGTDDSGKVIHQDKACHRSNAHNYQTQEMMMNAGKVLIGTAMLVFSLALMVTPSGGAPAGDALPFWQEPGQGPGPSLAGCIPERESMTGTAGQAMPAATVEDGGPRIVRDAPRAWNRSSLQPYRACCPVPAHCDKGCPV